MELEQLRLTTLSIFIAGMVGLHQLFGNIEFNVIGVKLGLAIIAETSLELVLPILLFYVVFLGIDKSHAIEMSGILKKYRIFYDIAFLLSGAIMILVLFILAGVKLATLSWIPLSDTFVLGSFLSLGIILSILFFQRLFPSVKLVKSFREYMDYNKTIRLSDLIDELSETQAILVMLLASFGLFAIYSLGLIEFSKALGYTIGKNNIATILAASGNLTFVTLVLFQIRDSAKSLERQEEHVKAQKASYEPIIESEVSLSDDKDSIELNISNVGRGPAKDVLAVFELGFGENKMYKCFNLGNLPEKQTFVPGKNDEPHERLEIGKDDSLPTPLNDNYATQSLSDLVKDNGKIDLRVYIYAENILNEENENKLKFSKSLEWENNSIKDLDKLENLMTAGRTYPNNNLDKDVLSFMNDFEAYTRTFEDESELHKIPAQVI